MRIAQTPIIRGALGKFAAEYMLSKFLFTEIRAFIY